MCVTIKYWKAGDYGITLDKPKIITLESEYESWASDQLFSLKLGKMDTLMDDFKAADKVDASKAEKDQEIDVGRGDDYLRGNTGDDWLEAA